MWNMGETHRSFDTVRADRSSRHVALRKRMPSADNRDIAGCRGTLRVETVTVAGHAASQPTAHTTLNIQESVLCPVGY
jgi:hypothetical protein